VTFFLLFNTREYILKNVIKQLMVAIDFHSRKKKCDGSQWPLSIGWLPTFFKISSVMFNRIKQLIQLWNNIRVSKR